MSGSEVESKFERAESKNVKWVRNESKFEGAIMSRRELVSERKQVEASPRILEPSFHPLKARCDWSPRIFLAALARAKSVRDGPLEKGRESAWVKWVNEQVSVSQGMKAGASD